MTPKSSNTIRLEIKGKEAAIKTVKPTFKVIENLRRAQLSYAEGLAQFEKENAAALDKSDYKKAIELSPERNKLEMDYITEQILTVAKLSDAQKELLEDPEFLLEQNVVDLRDDLARFRRYCGFRS